MKGDIPVSNGERSVLSMDRSFFFLTRDCIQHSDGRHRL